jgi:hypothetical protein
LNDGSGGNGGFGGGGGGAGDISSNGGMGGYGGGGGASGLAGGTSTGLGGFGGGGAGGATGGFGAGDGAVSIGFPGGGGGAALGGALFVQEGGSLTLAGPLTINGSSVAGGQVRDADASPGSAFGSGIFLQGSGTPLSSGPGAGDTQTIADDIADQAGSGGTGSRALTKSGLGALVLSGANTYSGATTVDGGTLLVNSPGSLASAVTVNSTGTLGGTGLINNSVTVTSGGSIAAGTSTGILSTGALTLGAGSTLTAEIDGATAGALYDQINVAGSVTLDNATLDVVPGFTPVAGQVFTIIANDLADPVAGTLAGLPEASIFQAGDARFSISYAGGSGNDVTLTAISPPTIEKAFGSLAVLVNADTTLTFTLANPNATTALTGVAFTDTLPAGLTVSNPNGLVNTCGGTVTAVTDSGSVVLVDGELAAGAACTITVNVTGLAGGLKTNTTSAVTSTEGGPGGIAAAFLIVVEPPDVAPPTIVKAFGAASIVVDGSTALTITLTNPNPVGTLSGLAFTDTLPAGLVVANPNGLANACGGTVTATAGTGSVTLADGSLPANASCAITVDVTATTGGSKINTTGAVSSIEGGTGGTATASLLVIAPPTIAKDFGAETVALDGSTTLTFNLANPNPATALTGVAFTDIFPAGLVVASPNGLANSCGGTVTATAGGSSVTLSGGVLPGSGICTITVNVTGTASGSKQNVTGLVSSTETGNGGLATADLTVVAPPTIAKAFGAESILLDGSTSLTFTLANPNPATALTGVAFTDTLPEGLVVADPNELANTCGGAVVAEPGTGTGSVALVDGELAADGDCTITVNVAATTAGVKDNLTSAVTSAEGGAGNTAAATITVIATSPEFTVTKQFDDFNTEEVEVHLSCNTGVPLDQSRALSPEYVDAYNNQVTFILTELADGAADCTVSETPVPGYEAEYLELSGTGSADADGCHYAGVVAGDELSCLVINHVLPVPVTVEKTWTGASEDEVFTSEISLECSNVVAGSKSSWSWQSLSSDGGDTFVANVKPSWDGSTNCSVFESNSSQAIEVSGCESPISVSVDEATAGCTLSNTVFYEGIPALNPLGASLLVLLTLGLGVIGFRRLG